MRPTTRIPNDSYVDDPNHLNSRSHTSIVHRLRLHGRSRQRWKGQLEPAHTRVPKRYPETGREPAPARTGREPRGPGQCPGIESDVRSAYSLCPSPSVARVRPSRWCQGRPAGRAQRPLIASAMISDPTDGGRAPLTTRQCARRCTSKRSRKPLITI